MWVTQPKPDGAPGGSVECKGLSEMRSLMPAVHEFLTLTTLPDGSSRQVATLIVFADAGAIKVCLSDRQTGRSLWATADTLDDALGALDEAIQAGTADWRVSGGWKGAASRKRG